MDANKHFNKNILIDSSDFRYSNYTSVSQNYFPAATSNVGFTDFANGSADYHNYSLSSSSIYKSLASDGTDIGVNFSLLDAAFNAQPVCATTGLDHMSENNLNFTLYPNPVNDILNIEIFFVT